MRRLVYRLRDAGLDPARAALPARPAARRDRADRAGRGHAALGAARGRAPAAVPADAGRPRLRRACASTRQLRTVRSPYADGEEFVAVPALRLDVALVHMNRADARRERAVPRARTRTSTTCTAWRPIRRSCPASASCRPARCSRRAAAVPAGQPGHGARRGRDAERRALHQLRARLRPGRGVPGRVRGGRRRPEPWPRFRADYLAGDEADYQEAVRGSAPRGGDQRRCRDATCATTAPTRLRGRLRGGLARRRRDPGQPDGRDPVARRPAGPAHVRARPAAHRRRGATCSTRTGTGGGLDALPGRVHGWSRPGSGT